MQNLGATCGVRCCLHFSSGLKELDGLHGSLLTLMHHQPGVPVGERLVLTTACQVPVPVALDGRDAYFGRRGVGKSPD